MGYGMTEMATTTGGSEKLRGSYFAYACAAMEAAVRGFMEICEAEGVADEGLREATRALDEAVERLVS